MSARGGTKRDLWEAIAEKDKQITALSGELVALKARFTAEVTAARREAALKALDAVLADMALAKWDDNPYTRAAISDSRAVVERVRASIEAGK